MLGFIDRFLTLWIFLAIFLGLILGIIFPNIALFWNLFEYKSVNVVLTLCLILMMYPPLAKVDYAKLSKVFDSKKVILLSVGGKIKCRKRKIKCRIFATNYLSFNLKLKL